MYTPTNWIDGDIITEQKLNKLEQGLEDAGCKVAVVNVLITAGDPDYIFTPDKTFAEVMELIGNGHVPVYVVGDNTGYLIVLPTIVFTDPEDERYSIQIDLGAQGDGTYAHDATGFHPVST